MARLLIASYDRRVYAWEYANVHPHDTSLSDEQTTRALVRHVWEQMGLQHPPKVVIAPRMSPYEGHAHRTDLTVGPRASLATVLHELAHAMDVSLESSLGMGHLSDETPGTCHDANWMGLYVRMLDRFYGGIHFNEFYLWKTLSDAGLEFKVGARPRCI